MIFGLDGVEIGLLIVFLCLFAGILSGFPVAFAISGAAIISFAIIAALDSSGYLIHQAIDTASAEFNAITATGVRPDAVTVFRYPELPRVGVALFPQGWETALDRNLGFIVNRINERVLAGASIETLLAVLMFVMMGITLERSRIADDLLVTMARVFGPLPGGLAVSIVVVGAFLAASTGIVGATVVTMARGIAVNRRRRLERTSDLSWRGWGCSPVYVTVGASTAPRRSECPANQCHSGQEFSALLRTKGPTSGGPFRERSRCGRRLSGSYRRTRSYRLRWGCRS